MRLTVRERLGAAWRLVKSGEVREAFNAAVVNRLSADWLATTRHPDEEIRSGIRRLRARARDLGRNNSYVKQFLRLLTTNVIGHAGIKLQADVRTATDEKDKLANRAIETAFKAWSRRVTLDKKQSLNQLQVLLLKTVARDGEAFVRKIRGADNPYRFALQPLDPDLIDETYNVTRGRNQNEIRLGVEVDPTGAPAAYWIKDYPERASAYGNKRVRVPAEEIIHLYLPERIAQTRGVTWMTAAMGPSKMLVGYTESELVAARTAAAKMGWIQSKDGAVAGEMSADPNANLTYDASPGVIEKLPTGYEFQAWDPTHPVAAFGPFVKTMLREIASGLNVSYNLLANDLEGVNYSSMRSGLLNDREVWRELQAWWVDTFLWEIYPEFLNMALLAGALELTTRDASRYATAARWIPRGWPWVDPLKDGQAGALGIANGLTSRRRLLSEQGYDFEEILEELAEETALAKEYGVPLAKPGTTSGAAPSSPPAQSTAQPAGENGDGEEQDPDGENGDARTIYNPRRLRAYVHNREREP